MTLRCPIAFCAKVNDASVASCTACGTPLAEYARLQAHSAWLFNRALLEAKANRTARARDLFAAVVQWCPGDVAARNALALACYQGGDHAEARRQWAEVIRARPQDTFAGAWLSKLDRR